MPVRIYVHASWTTFARLPLIDQDLAVFLDRFVRMEVNRQFDVPRLMQGLKGASARIANRDGIARHKPLRWAQGYDLRSTGPRQLRGAVSYVRGQGDRHPERALIKRP